MVNRMLMLCSAALLWASSAEAQKSKVSVLPEQPSFADIADLADVSPIVAEVRVRRAQKIKIKRQPVGFPARFLAEADVLSLIRGAAGLPPRIRYVIEVHPDSLGRIRKIERGVMLVFAQAVPGREGEIQLASPDSQLVWNEQLGADVRAVVRAIASPGAPPKVTGISRAFHTAGALAGEGESQIFLETADGSPVSLMVTRTAGTAPRWTAAYGDVVDPDAPPPARNTIGWYRLACFLPSALPPAALEGTQEGHGTVLATDYAMIRAALGPCPRTRVRQAP